MSSTVFISFFIGAIFMGIILGPILGVLRPIQSSLAVTIGVAYPESSHNFFFMVVVPGVIFSALLGVALLGRVWLIHEFTPGYRVKMTILAFFTCFVGLTVLHSCECVVEKTIVYNKERRMATIPDEFRIANYDCI